MGLTPVYGSAEKICRAIQFVPDISSSLSPRGRKVLLSIYSYSQDFRVLKGDDLGPLGIMNSLRLQRSKESF